MILLVYRDHEDLVPYREAADAAELQTVCKEATRDLTMAEYDGLILTGGTDVDPELYGESRHAETEESDTERDQVEIRLLREALDRDLPVLAICRGVQLMNVALGGSLVQHLDPPERHRVRRRTKSDPAHEIRIEPGSLLASIAGSAQWQVNSRHHQAVKKLGAGLRISATDPADGTVEAIERPDKAFVLGVQWHPENQVFTQPDQLKLFRQFGQAATLRPL